MTDDLSLRDAQSRRAALRTLGATGLAATGLCSTALGRGRQRSDDDCTWTHEFTYRPLLVETPFDSDIRFDLLSAVGWAGPCEVRTPGYRDDGTVAAEPVEYTIATAAWATAQFVGGEKDGEPAARLSSANGLLGTTEITYPYGVDDPTFRSDPQFVGARRGTDGDGETVADIAHGTGAANAIESWAAGQFVSRLGSKVPLLGMAVDLVFAAGMIQEFVNIISGKKAHTDQFTLPAAVGRTPIASMHRQFRWVMSRSETAEIEVQNLLARAEPPESRYGNLGDSTYESFEHTISLDPAGGDSDTGTDESGGFDWLFW